MFIKKEVAPAYDAVGTVVALNDSFEIVEGGYCIAGRNGIAISQFDSSVETMYVNFNYICE
jgi:hypothetical protein